MATAKKPLREWRISIMREWTRRSLTFISARRGRRGAGEAKPKSSRGRALDHVSIRSAYERSILARDLEIINESSLFDRAEIVARCSLHADANWRDSSTWPMATSWAQNGDNANPLFRDNLIEVLGRLADLSVAQAAFDAAVAKHPDKRICLRQVCRVIRRGDKPR